MYIRADRTHLLHLTPVCRDYAAASVPSGAALQILAVLIDINFRQHSPSAEILNQLLPPVRLLPRDWAQFLRFNVVKAGVSVPSDPVVDLPLEFLNEREGDRLAIRFPRVKPCHWLWTIRIGHSNRLASIISGPNELENTAQPSLRFLLLANQRSPFETMH
jgi:hypothetical protein